MNFDRRALAMCLLGATACSSNPAPSDVGTNDATSEGASDAPLVDAMDTTDIAIDAGADALAMDSGPDASGDSAIDVADGSSDSGATITGTTYYVDCNSGSDTAAGTSPSTAWRTLTKANGATLQPGDGILFARGCTWTGEFHAAWTGTAAHPIVLGAYGTGANPIVRGDAMGTDTSAVAFDVSGSYEVLQDLVAMVANPATDASCVQADGSPMPVGWYVGFSVSGSYDTLWGVEGHDLALGVDFDDASSFNRVIDGYFHDNHMFWRVDATAGPLGGMGVNLHGTHNEVGFCRFERNEGQCTLTGGALQNYSAPFEVYNANGCYAHHNVAFGHRKHFEMGHDSSHTTDDVVLAYNLFVSDHPNAVGPNIHGAPPYGPVNRTLIYQNTIVFTGPNSQGIVCDGDGTVVRDNLFVAEWKSAYYAGSFTEDHNLYWDLQQTTDSSPDPFVQFDSTASPSAPSATSMQVDPQFANAVVPSGDYHLQASSPAIDVGGTYTTSDPVLQAILAEDIDHAVAPQGVAYDLGAYERSH